MCTAISYNSNNHYFGRNLDWHFSYGEKLVITPRKFPIKFRHVDNINSHYAIYGTAIIEEAYPLYFEGVNEVGLCVASLNFPDNAKYFLVDISMVNISSFEFIPWVLSQCKTINEVVCLLNNVNICIDSFNEKYPPSPLHWIISDNNASITVESLQDGLRIYDNPYGVLTNNPTFDIQVFNLNNYIGLSSENHKGNFADKVRLEHYSYGMGAIGLPGDLSSSSRFVRGVFTKENSICFDDEYSSVNQFFHILDSVSQKKGCNKVADEQYEYTIYSSCYNTTKNIYYYNTYENQQISAIDINKIDTNGNKLMVFELNRSANFYKQN